jgi:tRNA-dihydrouridine synthase B
MDLSYIDDAPLPTFHVKTLPVYGDLVLAPMDGYSDLPFRSICRELGSAMSYTEFISVLEILQGHPYVAEKLAYFEAERPVVYQIFDSDPERLLETALRLQERRPDIIDINMGCSVRSVSGRGAGAGLLREPAKIARIFALLSRSLEVPVTGKIRLGWDEASRNYLEVARAVEENGGALLAVHARTRAQKYQGKADWDAIAEVKASVKIPVIGNGDVCTPEDIVRMKSYTSCDAVMIGRGAVGNPWIFSRLRRDQVPVHQVQQVLECHLERMLAYYGAARGLVLFRKHANQYLQSYDIDPVKRQALLTVVQPDEFREILQQIFHQILV